MRQDGVANMGADCGAKYWNRGIGLRKVNWEHSAKCFGHRA